MNQARCSCHVVLLPFAEILIELFHRADTYLPPSCPSPSRVKGTNANLKVLPAPQLSTSGSPRLPHRLGLSSVRLGLHQSVKTSLTLANFPAIRPSAKTPFIAYTRDDGSSDPFAEQHTLIAGETEDVEFFSTNRDRTGSTEGADCQYLPAIYDPEKGTLDIHTSAPLYLLAHRVKRLRTAHGPTAGASRAADYRAKRNDLGEAFGTKKAKSQIRAAERDKVDVGAMQGIKGHLMETIGEKAPEETGESRSYSILLAARLMPVALPSELIPTPDTTISEPLLVYPRASIIPDAEFSSIDASSLLKARDDKSRAGLLPWRRSRFVEEKLRTAAQSSAPSAARKQTARLAYYLAALLAFNDLSPRLSKISKSELPSKFPGLPTQVLNGMLERFAEPISKRHTVSEKMKTKLLAFICTLFLVLDECNTDATRVAKELNIVPNK